MDDKDYNEIQEEDKHDEGTSYYLRELVYQYKEFLWKLNDLLIKTKKDMLKALSKARENEIIHNIHYEKFSWTEHNHSCL